MSSSQERGFASEQPAAASCSGLSSPDLDAVRGDDRAPIHFDRLLLASTLPRLDLQLCLTKMFGEPAENALRSRVDASRGREMLLMPAHSEDFAGAKILNVIPGNAGSRHGVISGLFVLFDFETGAPLATMDAGELTAWRTAAVSALAANVLANRGATELAIVGAGHLVPYLASALTRVRPIRRVNLWARRREQAEQTAQRVSGMLDDIDVIVCSGLRQAVESADIVTSATRSKAPIICGDWLRPGTHVDLVGGYRPDMRELDDRGIQRGKIFVDSYEGTLAEAGDLIGPLEHQIITREDIAGDLFALVSGNGCRASSEDITIFKSVGTGLADLAVAVALWEDWLSREGL